MGRLIDADKWKDRLKRNSIFEKITDSAGMNVYEIIDEQPTAYDVEKVVEQLEKASTVYDLSNCELAIRQDIALHIVRAGGKE